MILYTGEKNLQTADTNVTYTVRVIRCVWLEIY